MLDKESEAVRKWLHNFPSQTPVVVIPIFNAYEDVIECMESLLKCTPADVPILALDDASTDKRITPALERFNGDRCLYVRKSTNTGFVNTVNLAFAWCAPHDVVVINSDVIVPPGWIERLQTAAYIRSNVATATPLTNHGTIVSVPFRNTPTDIEGMSVEEIDRRIQANSLRLYPIIPTAVGHCVYFRRSALEIVGYFDETFSPGYGEEVDFCQRAVIKGFSHVLADDLFVYHKGSRSFGAGGEKERLGIRDFHERIVRKRYPWYAEWTAYVASDRDSPLAYAIEQARDALLGHRIAIDATCLGGPITGTQLNTIGLIRSLAKAKDQDVRLSIIVHDHILRTPSHLFGVETLVDEVLPLSALQGLSQPRFSLVHRPFQLHTIGELAFLRTIASRVVVSVLDFIAFSNVGYAVNYTDWENYRRLTRLACEVADGIVFLSQDTAFDAAHQGIQIPKERMAIIPPGTDYRWNECVPDAVGVDVTRVPKTPYILVLGTNFRHKNRLYALRLFQNLVNQYGWDGILVLAGPSVSYGGSEDEEVTFLQRNPDVRARVHNLGAVTEAEKRWLLQRASLILYPSVYEGFGLVPFEAAAAGTPALTLRTTSLTEVLGDDVLYLEARDLQEDAEKVWSVLTTPAIANHQVATIQARMKDFTWDKTAALAWDFYRRVLAMPPRPQRTVVWEWVTIVQPDLMPRGGPLVIRIGRRLKRALEASLVEWLKLGSESYQLIRSSLDQISRRKTI